MRALSFFFLKEEGKELYPCFFFWREGSLFFWVGRRGGGGGREVRGGGEAGGEGLFLFFCGVGENSLFLFLGGNSFLFVWCGNFSFFVGELYPFLRG